MRMEDDSSEDPFTTKLLTLQQDGIDFNPVIANRALLQTLGPGEVISSFTFFSDLTNIPHFFLYKSNFLSFFKLKNILLFSNLKNMLHFSKVKKHSAFFHLTNILYFFKFNNAYFL